MQCSKGKKPHVNIFAFLQVKFYFNKNSLIDKKSEVNKIPRNHLSCCCSCWIFQFKKLTQPLSLFVFLLFFQYFYFFFLFIEFYHNFYLSLYYICLPT